MTIPIELIIAFLSMIGGTATVVVHLLIRISSNVSDIKSTHLLAAQKTELEMASLKRHDQRNEEELKLHRKILGHQHHQIEPERA